MPVEVKEYIPATPTEYGVDQVPKSAGPHVVFFFPKETGYTLLHSAGFIGPSVKLNLKAAHEGAFNIVFLTTKDGRLAYRVTFVEHGVVKKIEPVYTKANGCSIDTTTAARPMLFPTWIRLLKQLGPCATHLLYISFPKTVLLNSISTVNMTIGKPLTVDYRKAIKIATETEMGQEKQEIEIGMHNQLFILNVCCDYPINGRVSRLMGPRSDSNRMNHIFNGLKSQPNVINPDPSLRTLVNPGLEDVLNSMDEIYSNANAGDSIIFYFTGYGRKIFHKTSTIEAEETREPSNQKYDFTEEQRVYPEPLAGLVLVDGNMESSLIEHVNDLTSLWIRYWCNALYLAKGVKSVALMIDASFVDPGEQEPASKMFLPTGASAHPDNVNSEYRDRVDKIRIAKSLRPHILAENCNFEQLPPQVREPTWFKIGKSLDNPKDSLRVQDTVNEAPFYFAPSIQWANKHVVMQASRDNEIAYEEMYKSVENAAVRSSGNQAKSAIMTTKPLGSSISAAEVSAALTKSIKSSEVDMRASPFGSMAGRFTYALSSILELYFLSEDEIAAPAETYSVVFDRVTNLVSKITDNCLEANPVSYIGAERASEVIFTNSIIPPIHSSVYVEALSPETSKLYFTPGWIGLPTNIPLIALATVPMQHDLDCDPTRFVHKEVAVIENGAGLTDPFIGEAKILDTTRSNLSTLLRIKPGSQLQVLPIPEFQVRIATPYGSFSASSPEDNDKELLEVARELNSKLLKSGYVSFGHNTIEHQSHDSIPSFWDWTLFGPHPWGLASNVCYAAVIKFASTDLDYNKGWETVCSQIRAFINSTRGLIISSITKELLRTGSGKTSATTSDANPMPCIDHISDKAPEEAGDYYMTLLRLRAVLVRYDTIFSGEDNNKAWEYKLAHRLAQMNISRALDLAPKEDARLTITVCRNNVVPPQEDISFIRRTLKTSHRMIAPPPLHLHLVLDLPYGTIAKKVRKDFKVGSYLMVQRMAWQDVENKVSRINGLAKSEEDCLAIYWHHLFWQLSTLPSATTSTSFSTIMTLDMEELIEISEKSIETFKRLDTADAAADFAQMLVLAGCIKIKTDPTNSIEYFKRAQLLLLKSKVEIDTPELDINLMMAYIYKAETDEEGESSCSFEACKILIRLYNAYSVDTNKMTYEGCTACLMVLIKLSELVKPNSTNPWPLTNAEYLELNRPDWVDVVKFIISSYMERNAQPSILSTDDRANVVASLAHQNTLGLLNEMCGNYNEATHHYESAGKLLKWITPFDIVFLTTNGDGDDDGARFVSEFVKDMNTIVLSNQFIVQRLMTDQNKSTLNNKAVSDALNVNGPWTTNVLDWAHALFNSDLLDEAHKMYDCILTLQTQVKGTRPLVDHLKIIIAAYKSKQKELKDIYSECATEINRLSSVQTTQGATTAAINEPVSLLLIGALLPIYEISNNKTLEAIGSGGAKPPRTLKQLSSTEVLFNELKEQGLDITHGDRTTDLVATITSIKLNLIYGLQACEMKNFTEALDCFKRVPAIYTSAVQSSNWYPRLPKPLKDHIEELQSIASKYILYTNQQTKFLLASTLPFDLDSLLFEPDRLTNSTTYLTIPVEASLLYDNVTKWYWRNLKQKRLIEANMRMAPKITPKYRIGYRKESLHDMSSLPSAIRTAEEDLTHIDGYKLDPLNLTISLSTKVASAVPRASAFIMYDSERVELKMTPRDELTTKQYSDMKLDIALKKKIKPETVQPKIRHRFHVLDFRSDGSSKVLTCGTNMSGHALNLPIVTPDARCPVRLGSITAQHEPLSLYYANTLFNLHTPLTHTFTMLIRELDDARPPIIDARFFEQRGTLNTQTEPFMMRTLITSDYEEVKTQLDSRVLAYHQGLPIIDGDSFQVEWFRMRSLSTPTIATKFFVPDENLCRKLKIKPVSVNFERRREMYAGGTRVSPIRIQQNYYSQNLVVHSLAAPSKGAQGFERRDIGFKTSSNSDNVLYLLSPSASSSFINDSIINSSHSRVQHLIMDYKVKNDFKRRMGPIVLQFYAFLSKRYNGVYFKDSLPIYGTRRQKLDYAPLPPSSPIAAVATLATTPLPMSSSPSSPAVLAKEQLDKLKTRIADLAILTNSCIISYDIHNNFPNVILVDATNPDKDSSSEYSVAPVHLKSGVSRAISSLLNQSYGSFTKDTLQRLYEWLIQPIDSLLPEKTSPVPPLLIFTSHSITGDNAILRVPFAALHSGKFRDRRGDFLVQRYLISYQLSIKSLERACRTYYTYRRDISLTAYDRPRRVIKTKSDTTGVILNTIWMAETTQVTNANEAMSELIVSERYSFSSTRPIRFLHLSDPMYEIDMNLKLLKTVAWDARPAKALTGVDLLVSPTFLQFSPSIMGSESIMSVLTPINNISQPNINTSLAKFYATSKIAARIETATRTEFWKSIQLNKPLEMHAALQTLSNSSTMMAIVDTKNMNLIKRCIEFVMNATLKTFIVEVLPGNTYERLKVPIIEEGSANTINEAIDKIKEVELTMESDKTAATEPSPIVRGHAAALKNDYKLALELYKSANYGVAQCGPIDTMILTIVELLAGTKISNPATTQRINSLPPYSRLAVRSFDIINQFYLITTTESASDAQIERLVSLQSQCCELVWELEVEATRPVADLNELRQFGILEECAMALASFILWRHGAVKERVKKLSQSTLAIRKKKSTTTTNGHDMDNLLKALTPPVIDGIVDFIGSLAPMLHVYSRATSKIAVLRESQLKFFMTSLSMSLSSSSSMSASVIDFPGHEWANMALFGYPWNDDEFYFMSPARQFIFNKLELADSDED